MTAVVDASVVVAALVDTGPPGRWAEPLLAQPMVAPHLMPVEVANIPRRAALGGVISDAVASLAHHDLLDTRIELLPYCPFASRVWELRDNLTTHDAWYVAIAESLELKLATLDVRIRRAPGVRCDFELPPEP